VQTQTKLPRAVAALWKKHEREFPTAVDLRDYVLNEMVRLERLPSHMHVADWIRIRLSCTGRQANTVIEWAIASFDGKEPAVVYDMIQEIERRRVRFHDMISNLRSESYGRISRR
jgi:hypothetical protein